MNRDSAVDRMELNGGEILAHAIEHNFSYVSAPLDYDLTPNVDAHRIMEMLRIQLINDADWHREHCDKECNVSLFWLRRAGELAGIAWTDEESKRFM